MLAGKPVVRGTRLSVPLILGHLAQGWSIDDLLDSYPRLSGQGIRDARAHPGAPPRASDGMPGARRALLLAGSGYRFGSVTWEGDHGLQSVPEL